MKKIEWIWRHMLAEFLSRRQTDFRQQELARLFSISSSTVHLALAPLRQLAAIRVGGRGFEIIDAEKILYHWTNHRRLNTDARQNLHVNLPILEIEGLLPDGSIPTAYTAFRELFNEPPSDYDKVYCYHARPAAVTNRFEPHVGPGPDNLFVLQADPHLSDYGTQMSLGQLFVDLWNLPDWYAKEFVNAVKVKFDELLS